MLDLVAKQLEKTKPAPEEVRFPVVAPRVEDGTIQVLTDIPPYVEISNLAKLLSRNSTRLKELINNVEEFKVKKLAELAMYCGLTLDQAFALVARQIEMNSSRRKNKAPM